MESVRAEVPFIEKLFYEFFGALENNEIFFLVSHRRRTTKDLVDLWKRLGKLNEGICINAYNESYFDLGTTLLNYDISFYGTERRSFRLSKYRNANVCRFCGREEGTLNSCGSKVTFKKKAHLISEALGNKKLISLDECDCCNEYFSVEIEPSIVSFFSLFRSLYGIHGKGGKKTLKGKSFVLDPDKGFDIKLPRTVEDLYNDRLEVKLKTHESYVPVAVYKCLCKFILGVLTKDELPHYSDTVRWLYDKADVGTLPKIAYFQNKNFYTEQPYLVKYKRHTEDRTFPDLIGEFRYSDIVLVFIVPFGKNDQKRFVDDEEVSLFWDNFIRHRKDMPWQFIDFTSSKPIEMEIDFKVENIKIGENTFLSKEKI